MNGFVYIADTYTFKECCLKNGGTIATAWSSAANDSPGSQIVNPSPADMGCGLARLH